MDIPNHRGGTYVLSDRGHKFAGAAVADLAASDLSWMLARLGGLSEEDRYHIRGELFFRRAMQHKAASRTHRAGLLTRGRDTGILVGTLWGGRH